MNDPWTWTTGREMTVGVRGWLGGGEQRGKNWDNCNRITIKYLILKKGATDTCYHMDKPWKCYRK